MEPSDHQNGNNLAIECVIKRENDLLRIDDDSPTLGIALSGGGIRSASFGLGVLQALKEHNILQKADYLSTVSGGGYIGSAITWFRKTEGACEKPFRFLGEKHIGARSASPDKPRVPSLVDFIRQHGNYLTPGKGLNLPSVLAVVLRSLVFSVAIYLTLLVVVLSFLAFLAYLPSHNFPELLGYDHLVASVTGGQKMTSEKDKFEKIAWPPKQGDRTVTTEVRKKQAFPGSDRALFHFCVLATAVFLTLFLMLTVVTPVVLKILRWYPGPSPGDHASSPDGNSSYKVRLYFQKICGILLLGGVCAAVLATVPIAEAFISERIEILGVTGYLSGVWAALARVRKHMGAVTVFDKAWIGDLLFRFGAVIFVYASLVLAYHLSLFALDVPAGGHDQWHGKTFWILGVIAVFALLLGWVADINDSTIAKMYRDRLMETFLPDRDVLHNNRWQPAYGADHAYLEDMCRDENETVLRPYHLINTNVILFGSENEKYKWRGGDSFLLSPEFCGSDATGYIETKKYMKRDNKKGMTLPTAMAVSGAAVNPHTGVGGVGPTRDVFVSLMMTLFNIRLGIWTTNPRNEAKGRSPNYWLPGLKSLLSLGYSEKSDFIELSDGGHFENLGVYELIRRRVKTIIISDAGQDKDFSFGDLANAIERVRADFGVTIRFWPEDEELGRLLPGSLKDNLFMDKYKLAQRGYAIGSISYPATDNLQEKTGNIYLIKPTLLAQLPADIYGYKARHEDFPAETTGDQFFDENQFDAYRELGYRAADPLGELLVKEDG